MIHPAVETTAPERLREIAVRTGGFRIAGMRRVDADTHDWHATIQPAAGSAQVHLLIEVKSAPTARQTNAWLDRLAGRDATTVPVLCADRISERVAEICRARGAGYFDASGSCHLRTTGLHVHVEGRSVPSRPAHTRANLFALKSSRLARVLLSEPGRAWQVQELAATADVSLGLASRVKQGLVDAGYVDVAHRRVRLVDPRGLLDAWSAAYTPPADATGFYSMSDPDAIVQGVASWCKARGVPYALTGLMAAWRTAPMVRPQTTRVYVDPTYAALDGPRLEETLDARRVDSGTNLVIVRPADPYVFHGRRSIRGASVVSSVQLYLDLRGLAGRGDEAATEVLERDLEPTWRE